MPQLEGSDPRLKTNYATRKDAINKCYAAAKERNMIIFAVQHGGWCAADDNLDGYKKYGSSKKCSNGKGGEMTSNVYKIAESDTGAFFSFMVFPHDKPSYNEFRLHTTRTFSNLKWLLSKILFP